MIDSQFHDFYGNIVMVHDKFNRMDFPMLFVGFDSFGRGVSNIILQKFCKKCTGNIRDINVSRSGDV